MRRVVEALALVQRAAQRVADLVLRLGVAGARRLNVVRDGGLVLGDVGTLGDGADASSQGQQGDRGDAARHASQSLHRVPSHHPGIPYRGTAAGGIRRMGRSEEHTSELQSLMRISYAVFCLTNKKRNTPH